jgi:hypothetical protein
MAPTARRARTTSSHTPSAPTSTHDRIANQQADGNDTLKGNKGDDTGSGGPGSDKCRVAKYSHFSRN